MKAGFGLAGYKVKNVTAELRGVIHGETQRTGIGRA